VTITRRIAWGLLAGLFLALVSMLSGPRPNGVPQAHAATPTEGSIANCDDFFFEFLGFIDIDVPDPGWVPVNEGNPGLDTFRSVSGEVTKSKITHTDYPDVHDSHDQNTDIKVDPGLEDVLSDAGKDDDGDGNPDTLEMEWETGILPNEFSGDGSAHFFPKWVWPSLGDRVWADGRWVFDCGHPNEDEAEPRYRTEIHPARAVASMRQQMRTMPGSGTTPVPITGTDLYIHGRAGVVTDILECGQEVVLGTGSCTTPFGAHDPVADHLGTPIDVDFDFDICTPAVPTPNAVLATFVEDGPGNTIAIAPELTTEAASGACAGGDFGPAQVHVEVPLAGSGVTPDDVYARKIYAGWIFPPEGLKHLQLTLDLMNLHDDLEPPGFDCECSFFWMGVDRAPNEWIRLADHADGNMNDYDDDQGLGDGEMTFSGASSDFYVGNGQPFNVSANGYDGGFGDTIPGADCLDDHFGHHDFGAHVNASVFPPSFPDFCYVLLAIDASIPDNDPYNDFGHTFAAPGYGIGHQDLPNPDTQYHLEFTIEDMPLTTEDSADLSLRKFCKPDEVAGPGQPLTCIIIVENSGPGLPRDVVVEDMVVTNVPADDFSIGTPTFTFKNGSTGATKGCEVTSETQFRCELGTVPVGGAAIITSTIISDVGGQFNNIATVETSSTDADLSNNRDEVTGLVVRTCKLGVSDTELVPPVISAVGIDPSPGLEGKPVTFTATATDNCNSPSQLHYKWTFSDGGSGFGSTTQHAFADNATYSGTVAVTDKAGNRAEKNFSVVINNQLPVISELPPVKAPWGVPIEFNGNATDPGTADKPNLKCRWDFGDGTFENGCSVTHAYEVPGDYTATFSVSDDKGTATATREVTINRRPTTIKNCGATQVFESARKVDLCARLLVADIDGGDADAGIKGKELQFAIAVTKQVRGLTDANGESRPSLNIILAQGCYPGRIEFKGDALYEPARYDYVFYTTGGNRPGQVCSLAAGSAGFALLDSDGDGCSNGQEAAAKSDPNNPYDFFDTPSSFAGRDKAVTVGDIARIVARFGSVGDTGISLYSPPDPAPAYHPVFDRMPGGQGPNGSITAQDIAVSASQFGDSCA
jgi:PKD repeat protein